MALAKPIETVTIKNSSNLAAAGYDPQTKDLSVQFQNGAAFRYQQVPRSKWNAFKKVIADPKKSAGSFFSVEIKTKFKAVKIEVPEEDYE